MKMINYILILLTAGLMSCCNDGSGPVDPPIDKVVFDLQWATRIEVDKEAVALQNYTLLSKLTNAL